jgi:hypothetical protein
MNLISTASCAAGALLAASSALATPIVGDPITLDTTSEVSVTFLSSDAGATGSLYFLGSEVHGVTFRSASTDVNDLGMFLFSNHGTTARSTYDLGMFGRDSTLHFAYLITEGVSVAPTGSLFRTDMPGDMGYFLVDAVPGVDGSWLFNVGIEDIRDEHMADWDFNDVIFEVNTRAVPAPGAAALLAMAGMCAGARRKRA